jgi:sugar lactone lactonase YvrE
MKRAVVLLSVLAALVASLGVMTVLAQDIVEQIDLDETAGEFPESLAVDADGNIYFGLAPTGEIRMITPSGDVSSFAKLPTAPEGTFGTLGLEFNESGELFAAMASFDESHGIWKISADGSETELFASLDPPGVPNVLDFHSDGSLFVSNTPGGAIWKIAIDGTVETWLADPLLAGFNPPGPVGVPLGSNGLLFDADESNLYVAVTEMNRIVKIPVNADGTLGTAEVFAEDAETLGGPDGMTWGPNGDLYVALIFSDSLSKISADGTITAIHSGVPLQNPSDVAFGTGDDANKLYIANFAFFRFIGLMPGDPTPGILTLDTTPPAPPATGDPIVSMLGGIGLVAGLILLTGGGTLVYVNRRRSAA